ncbi:MAG TPA: cytochrome C oxidase subunit IV family protein [Saprospiraceae bacterium]|nr:cytochrome C oxidase subunit IV family protein [Saprospiraceae bacterium]
MGHDYTGAKKIALKTIIILAIVTVVEVMIALTGKGYIVEGYHAPKILMNSLMISMSIYKAYLIVFEFMHMKYEAKGLMMSVLLPVCLLIWAVIAFLYEGNAWKHNRRVVQDRDKIELTQTPAKTE